jgi:hypothetical protein
VAGRKYSEGRWVLQLPPFVNQHSRIPILIRSPDARRFTMMALFAAETGEQESKGVFETVTSILQTSRDRGILPKHIA